ncbi:MAG: adenine-specific DNA-methyltransferase [Pirellulales bacterium]
MALADLCSAHAARSFSKDDVTIVNGDTTAVLDSVVADASVRLIFADPPYNIGKRFGTFHDKWPSDKAYAEWCFGWLEICLRKLNSDGSLYLMTSTQAMPYLDLWLRDRMTIRARIVWHYDSSGVQAKRTFGSMYEPILFCTKSAETFTFNADEIKVPAKTGAVRKLIDYRKAEPTVYNAMKIPGNVWYFPRVRYRMAEYEEHPTQKPESLLHRIVSVSSNSGDLVVDPFAGSFTTGVVAKQLGRRFLGIDSQAEYIHIGLRRLGICTTVDGLELKAPVKSHSRRNANGKKAPARAKGLPLFGETS